MGIETSRLTSQDFAGAGRGVSRHGSAPRPITLAAWDSHREIRPRAVPPDRAGSRRTTGPLAPRRAIAAALGQLRSEAGENLSDVAEALLISRSKLSRLENGQGRPMPRDIRDLVRHYGIDGTAQAERLLAWARQAQQPGWWSGYDDEVLAGLDTQLAYEADAAIKRTYALPFVPDLLQTAGYAAAILRDLEHRPERHLRQLLQLRERRQQVLHHRDGLPPLRLIVVMSEMALRQLVGSAQVMREQFDALAGPAVAPGVQLHVLPFTARPGFFMTARYFHFGYDAVNGERRDVVYVDTHAGFLTIEDPDQVARYRAAHDALVAASLTERQTRDFVGSLNAELYARS
ncbi:MAG: Scr1 family TA system antitoxin-like transcriptional regulator [Streptosporangiaceae bacterium]